MRFVYIFLLFLCAHGLILAMLEQENKNPDLVMKALQEQGQRDSFVIELTWASTEIQNSKNFKNTIMYLELIAEMFETKKETEKNQLNNIISRLQKKKIHGYDISYENLRFYTIKQGFETDLVTLREVPWNSENEWEKKFRYKILEEILKRKINSYTWLSDEGLANGLNNADATVQLDLIAGFSVPVSIVALYRAYTVAPSSIIKATLTNHIFAIAAMYIKSKMSAIAFIIISVAFWYALPRIEKRYPQNIRYFYDLIALLLFDRKIIGLL